MADSIFPENYFIDGTLKNVLLKLIDKKRKFDALKNKHIFLLWLTFILTTFYLYYLYKQILIPYSHSFSSMFSVFIGELSNLYALLLVIGALGFVNIIKQKRDKAEKEYHELRCEIIDKSKDLINNTKTWENRHEIYEVLKEKYDINLFHQAK